MEIKLHETSVELKTFNESLERRVYERTAELEEINDRFSQLAELSRTVAWELDVQGHITYISHLSKDVFGYYPEEMERRMYFYDLYFETERAEFKQSTFKFLNQIQPIQDVEEKYQHKDGHAVWVSTRGIPLLDSDLNLLGYRGTHTDITEQKKLSGTP